MMSQRLEVLSAAGAFEWPPSVWEHTTSRLDRRRGGTVGRVFGHSVGCGECDTELRFRQNGFGLLGHPTMFHTKKVSSGLQLVSGDTPQTPNI